MIQLYLNIFGLIVDLNVAIPKRKKPKNDNINIQEKAIFYDEIEEEEVNYVKPTDIELQAKRFEEELNNMGIYDIPNASDIPPTYEIQDDVEIITNEFEKEQQDMIERRREYGEVFRRINNSIFTCTFYNNRYHTRKGE